MNEALWEGSNKEHNQTNNASAMILNSLNKTKRDSKNMEGNLTPQTRFLSPGEDSMNDATGNSG